MRWTTSSLAVLAMGWGLESRAQLPPERVRVACDPVNPWNNCPGEDCACLEDSLEVTFDGDSQSLLERVPFEPNRSFESTIVIEAKAAGIQGWSYGVAHDERHLRLESVTVAGTDAAVAERGGFVIANMADVERCVSPPPRCDEVAAGGGYIAAVILSFTEPITLGPGRRPVSRAAYAFTADPGPPGTLISIVDRRLKHVGSPPVVINITVMGQSRMPWRVVDGWVGPGEAPAFEDCANDHDDDGDEALDCDDADCESDARCHRPPEHCGTGLDEDGDRLIDCNDPDCASWPSCQPPEICDNGSDDDFDGATDCEDPQCAASWHCGPPRGEICHNGVDDDGNGSTDCQDPACVAMVSCWPPETCDNGIDDDRDGLTDCDDPACFDSLVCPPRPEECRNFRDDDRDGATDCDDADCAAGPDCLPRPEICSNSWDDDRDGSVDCADADCEDEPACDFAGGPPVGIPGRPREICDNCRDDDGDGMVDGADFACAPLPAEVPDCAADALYFGRVASTDDHAIEGGSFVIALRNAEPATGFRLGVRRRDGGGIALYELASAPDAPGPASVSLASGGDVLLPERNTARGSLVDEVAGVERGSALCRWEGSDFLSVDLATPEGGPGFTVEYAAPATDGSAIPATSRGEPCSVNELLRVRLGRKPEPFRRGDADGSGRFSVADALEVLHVVLRHGRPSFDCEDILDANDDGRVNIVDGIAVLQLLFGKGPALPPPSQGCGLDLTPASRQGACSQSNCP